MNDNNKEIRRIRLEDLDSSLQNILLNRITKDDPTWKRIQDLIDDLYKKTHIEKKNITITITQSANQLITVICNGVKHTNLFKITKGTPYTIEFKLTNPNYIIGELNVPVSGIVIDDMTIQATPATPIMHTVSITQTPHQTIYVTCNGTKHSSTFTVQQGTPYTIEIVPDAWYAVGKIQGASSSGIVEKDMVITASNVTSQADYDLILDLTHYPSKNPTVYGMDVSYRWSSNTGDGRHAMGNISQDGIIDQFTCTAESTFLAFWGNGAPPVEFKTLDVIMTTLVDNKTYELCKNLPFDKLSSSGDITSNESNQTLNVAPKNLYEIFKANDGKKINLRLKLNK